MVHSFPPMLAPIVTVRFTCARCFSSTALALECRRPFQLIAGSKRPRRSGMASAAAPDSALAKSIDDLGVEDQPSTSGRPSGTLLLSLFVLCIQIWSASVKAWLQDTFISSFSCAGHRFDCY